MTYDFVVDPTVLMRENIALRNDLAPRDFGMLFLIGTGNTAAASPMISVRRSKSSLNSSLR